MLRRCFRDRKEVGVTIARRKIGPEQSGPMNATNGMTLIPPAP
jgi:hypothetical protein